MDDAKEHTHKFGNNMTWAVVFLPPLDFWIFASMQFASWIVYQYVYHLNSLQ